MFNNDSKLAVIRRAIPITLLLLLFVAAAQARAGVLESESEAPFGTFDGVEFILHSGHFVGETAQGPFRVPFEIVAPADTGEGNGTVVVEPPHFAFRTAARDGILGDDLLFEHGYSHASVGFGVFGLNILQPGSPDLLIAGMKAEIDTFPFQHDVEIVKQFAEALTSDPYAVRMLGQIERLYAYGVSQTAEVLNELFFVTGAEGLFDLTVQHQTLWRPPFADPRTLAVLPDDYRPLSGIGKVMLVGAEGDLLIEGETHELRNAVRGPQESPDYRLYEVAGAPHLSQPLPLNPLDNAPVVRAAFVAGDRWVRYGIRPPRSALLDDAPAGQIDPVYGIETGIARDLDGNATGGVQLPDVATGRALFIASIPVPIPPGLVGLLGSWFDLSCAPRPGSGSTEPRFTSNGRYVQGVWRQALRLTFRGYLLPSDAWAMVREARNSGVGDPGGCPST